MLRFFAPLALALAVATPALATCTADTPETAMSRLLGQAPGLSAKVLKLAMNAVTCAEKKGLVKRRDVLTVIDYSLPSSEPRLFVFNLITNKLLFRELVAH